MKIQTKLMVGFLSVSLLAAAIGFLEFYQLRKIAKPLNETIPAAIEQSQRVAELDRLANKIRYLQEIISQSPRNYLFTQKILWKQRYLAYLPEIEETIQKAIDSSSTENRSLFEQIKSMNTALAEMELSAIQDIDRKNYSAAEHILESQRYWKFNRNIEVAIEDYFLNHGISEKLSMSVRLVARDTQDILKNSMQITMLFVTGIFFLSLLISIIIIRSISRPLHQLTRHAENLSRGGDLPRPFVTASEGEFGALARAFKEMAAKISEREAEILESAAKLKEAVKMAHLGHWKWDVATGDCEWSDETYRIFTLDRKKFIPRIDSIMALSPWPEDNERDQEIIKKALENREQGSCEQRFLRPDGSIGYCFSTFQGIFDENDTLVTMLGTVQDITEQKSGAIAQAHLRQRLEAQWEIVKMEDADRKALCDRTLELLVSVSNSQYGFYGFMNEDETVLFLHAWSKEVMDGREIHNKPVEFPVERSGVWGNAIRERRILIINDMGEECLFKKGLPDGHVAIQRIMVVPVFRNQRIVALGAVANKADEYEESEAQELSAFLHSAQLIIDKQEAKEALLRSENFLNEVGRIARIGGWEMDLSTRKTKWTKATYDVLEIDYNQPIPGPDEYFDYWLPEFHSMIKKGIRGLIKDNVPLNFKAQARTARGHIIWLQVLGQAHFQDGECVRLSGTCQDISAHKILENSILEGAERFRTLVENIPGLVYRCELMAPWRLQYVSESALELTGYSVEQFIETQEINFRDLVLPEDLPGLERLIAEAVANRSKYQGEFRIRNASGGIRWVSQTGRASYDDAGNPLWLDGVIVDITEQHAAEDALRASEELYRNFYNTAPMAYMVWDKEMLVREWNDQAEILFGWTREEIIGQNLLDYIIPEISRTQVENIVDMLKRGELVTRVINENITKDGRVIVCEWNNSILKDLNGTITGGLSLGLDITARKEAEIRLKEYAETQAVLLREVNHRVKNNLAVIVSMLHEEEDLAERKGENSFLPVLHDLENRTMGLLTVHRMLSATNWRPLLLSQLCEQIISGIIKPSAADVKLNIPTAQVLVDSNQAHHLGMIINELATNILKYAISELAQTSIDVDIREEAGKIVLAIQDNGPGYPESIIRGEYSGTSIGFDLITGIVKKSLRGSISFKNKHGAVIEIIFDKIYYRES